MENILKISKNLKNNILYMHVRIFTQILYYQHIEKLYSKVKQTNPFFSRVISIRENKIFIKYRTNAMMQLNHTASLHRHEPFVLSRYNNDVAK